VRATFAVDPRQTLLQSNVRAAPYLVRVLGATVVGRSLSGFMVLRLPTGHPRLVSLTVERATSTPVELGRALSAAGLLALLALSCAGVVRALRRASPSRVELATPEARPAGVSDHEG
jgi:hypothetical protein